VWVHAASVGEVSLSRTLIQAIQQEYPDWDVVISTNTDTGQATAQKSFPSSLTFYLPFDLTWCVRSTLRRIRPDCIVLVELELWPNLLRIARRRGIPSVVVNGRITEKAAGRYRWLRVICPTLFGENGPGLYCVQNETYAARLNGLGVPRERVEIVGTMKFDALPAPENLPSVDGLAETFAIGKDDRVLVGGCTWPGEEEALLRTFKELRDQFAPLRLIIAPRHIERADEIARLIESTGFPCVRKTAVDSGDAPADLEESVVLVDTIGDLISFYGLATVVFVGKSLVPLGGQNMLEPAALAKPVLFGPHTTNFEKEAALLLQSDAAQEVADEEDLIDKTRALLADPEGASRMGRRAQEVVASQRGATARHITLIKPILSRKEAGEQ